MKTTCFATGIKTGGEIFHAARLFFLYLLIFCIATSCVFSISDVNTLRENDPIPHWLLERIGSAPTQIENYSLHEDPRMSTLNATGEGVVVAILDTGADTNHTSLNDMDDDPITNDPKIFAFKDFVNGRQQPYDDHGHGTHCAGLIAGTGKFGGVAPGSELVIVKVMNQHGFCYIPDIIQALNWCLEEKDLLKIDVISLSLGTKYPINGTSRLEELCNKMVENGVVVCVAAGNSGPLSKSIANPGTAEKVITVGAIDSSGTVLQMSSRGPGLNGEIKPDLVAVGVKVISAKAGSSDEYITWNGTSTATSQVAGAVAVLLGKHPNLEPGEVKDYLLKSADDLGMPGPDNNYGWGALNLSRALDLADSEVNGGRYDI